MPEGHDGIHPVVREYSLRTISWKPNADDPSARTPDGMKSSGRWMDAGTPSLGGDQIVCCQVSSFDPSA